MGTLAKAAKARECQCHWRLYCGVSSNMYPPKGDNCHLVLAHRTLKSIARQPCRHYVTGSGTEMPFHLLEVAEADG
eukprot:12924134-Prorocentrum_lima.AAC.1